MEKVVKSVETSGRQDQESTSSDNFISDTINWYLRWGGVLVSNVHYHHRVSECKGCDNFGLTNLGLMGCLLCGCPSATKPKVEKYFHPIKLRTVRPSCPIGKWEDIDNVFLNSKLSSMNFDDKSQVGHFRANPYARAANNVRIVDELNPGTTGQDDATVNSTGASVFSGIKYEGKDGVERFIQFHTQDNKTSQPNNYTLAIPCTADDLRDAIHYIIHQHEASPIVTVSLSGATYTIQHIGAGTLHALVMDGADEDFTRSAVSGAALEAAVEEDPLTENQREEYDKLIAKKEEGTITSKQAIRLDKYQSKIDAVAKEEVEEV